ncbi:MAG TPA: FG-GAP-like repeat-containing protein [Vicinamibacterales bacterium]|nr:FG-GAP-like repeat-containing protein [Vicinamibacterales bacterium]
MTRGRQEMAIAAGLVALLLCRSSAQTGIRFTVVPIDPGAAESVAVADVNNDGRLDIVSAESWYEAPAWTRRAIRAIPVASGYVDSFSDLPLDVDGDTFTDVIQIGYFARRIVWMRNPGRSGEAWTEHLIDAVGPTEFAFLVDLDNDGKADDLLPQFTGAAQAPLTWYDLQDGKWIKHAVSQRSYGHGIGAGDVNGDKRNDILTPQGWLEAPADPRAPGDWTFHAADWQQRAIPPPVKSGAASANAPPPIAVPPTTEPAPSPRGAEWGFLHAIDVNADGRTDVLTTSAHSYGLCWFEQRADGTWQQHVIDHSWSHAHASALADMDGDGRLDLVTGKRFQSRNVAAAGDDEPLGMYWYRFERTPGGPVAWSRHTIDFGGKAGAGLQIAVRDMDGDGDLDVVSAGKSGLYLARNENRSRSRR